MADMIKWLALVMVLSPANAAEHPERWYQDAWCTGDKEHRLHDRTRVDCLTETHAWEIDFAHKWAECIGQALYYASQTGRRAGCAIIIERDDDYRFLARLYAAVRHLPMDVVVITPPSSESSP